MNISQIRVLLYFLIRLNEWNNIHSIFFNRHVSVTFPHMLVQEKLSLCQENNVHEKFRVKTQHIFRRMHYIRTCINIKTGNVKNCMSAKVAITWC